MSTTPTERLKDIAAVIRSKNAGPYEVTLDVILASDADYDYVVSSGALSRANIARAYGIPEDDVRVLTEFPEGCAIKVTLKRRLVAGDLGDTDIMGAQQYAPLLDFVLPGR